MSMPISLPPRLPITKCSTEFPSIQEQSHQREKLLPAVVVQRLRHYAAQHKDAGSKRTVAAIFSMNAKTENVNVLQFWRVLKIPRWSNVIRSSPYGVPHSQRVASAHKTPKVWDKLLQCLLIKNTTMLTAKIQLRCSASPYWRITVCSAVHPFFSPVLSAFSYVWP